VLRVTGKYEELDRLTLVRCQQGDREACRKLVRLYQTAVFAMLHRMLALKRSRAVVDELAQETFLRVFKALAGFDPNGPARLSTWILTVASRLAIDELRRPSLMEPLSLLDEAIDDSLSLSVEQRALAEKIVQAVAELQPEFRETFVLSVYHECSHEEIAHALCVEIGTVKSRLSRAKAAVREKVGGEP
jgi:RNA polymerase sigma-70 factor (ECF subfamily)